MVYGLRYGNYNLSDYTDRYNTNNGVNIQVVYNTNNRVNIQMGIIPIIG